MSLWALQVLTGFKKGERKEIPEYKYEKEEKEPQGTDIVLS